MTPGALSSDARRARRALAALDGLRGLAILMVLFVHFIGDAPAIRRSAGRWSSSPTTVSGAWTCSSCSPVSSSRAPLRRQGLAALLPQLLRAADAAHLSAVLRRSGRALRRSSGAPGAVSRGPRRVCASPGVAVAVREQRLPGDSAGLGAPVRGPLLVARGRGAFYLLWPIVVLSFGRRSLLGICVAVSVLALVLRGFLAFRGDDYVAQWFSRRAPRRALHRRVPRARRAIGGDRTRGADREVVAWPPPWPGPAGVGLECASGLVHVCGPSASRHAHRAHLRGAADHESRGAGRGVLSRLLRGRAICFLGTRSYGSTSSMESSRTGWASTWRRWTP